MEISDALWAFVAREGLSFSFIGFRYAPVMSICFFSFEKLQCTVEAVACHTASILPRSQDQILKLCLRICGDE